MDELKKGPDGVYKSRGLSNDEKAILWHLARFTAMKAGIFIAINRFAKNMRAMEEKRQVNDLLNRIDEVADKLKEMGK